MRPMRLALRALLLPALLIAACGDEKRESACSVLDNGDGTRTIRCGDDEFRVPGASDGGTCVKAAAADGGGIIACTDGTTVVIDPDGNVVYPGAGGVVGRVTLAGELLDHSGTIVRAVGSERVAVTDEKGNFFLSDLPAGIYDLLVEREGWEPLRHRNTIAVGGILYLEPLVLRRGRQLGDSDAQVYVSPAEDTLLVQEGRSLWLHPVDRIDPVELSPNAVRPDDSVPGLHRPTYEAGGGAVLFLENIDPAMLLGRVRRYDIGSGTFTRLSERAMDFLPVAEGSALIWRAPVGAVGPADTAEVVLQYSDGFELPLGNSDASSDQADVAPGGRALALRGLDGTVVVDVDARTLFEPGDLVVVGWSPDGRKAALAARSTWTPLSDLFLLDHGTGSFSVLGADVHAMSVSFSRDGSRVLFPGNCTTNLACDLQVIDTRTFQQFTAPEASRRFLEWGFSPDGASVLYRREAGTSIHWDFERGRTSPLGDVTIRALKWSILGDRLVFADSDGACWLARFDADGTPGLFSRPYCEQIQFLPDGERATVVVWNESRMRRELRTWDGGVPSDPVAVLPGSPDADIRFASDGSAVLWTDRTASDGMFRMLVRDLIGGAVGTFPEAAVSYLGDFSPDGSFVVSISGDAELWVEEVATGLTTRIDRPVGVDRTLYRSFVRYTVEDLDDPYDGVIDGRRAGFWLSRYPRTVAP